MGVIKRFLIYTLITVLALLMAGGAWSLFLTLYYGKRIYTDKNDIPRTQAALVLGASVQQNKKPSPILSGRLNSAAELYHGLKVDKLLLSGDHTNRYYNETAVMQNYLEQEKAIPTKDIILDPYGFRTLDSVYHSRNNHNLHSITIVTQRFHLYRALFLADHFGIEAFGYSPNLSEEVDISLLFREFLAQGPALIDAMVLHRVPEEIHPVEP